MAKFDSNHPKKFLDVEIISKLNDQYLKEMTWYKNYEANRKRWKEKGENARRFSQEHRMNRV